MSLNDLFSAASAFAMAGWILLAVAPRWRWTDRLVVSGAWSLVLSLLYAILIVRYFGASAGGFGSIAEVRALFSNDALLLAGWVHYLAFDLLVGAFEVRQARLANFPHLLLIPILALTFFLGPIGLLAFFIARSIQAKRPVAVVPA